MAKLLKNIKVVGSYYLLNRTVGYFFGLQRIRKEVTKVKDIMNQEILRTSDLLHNINPRTCSFL